MGVVLLVRHGQASWGSEDYDVLSATGEEQARIVGRTLEGLAPDAVVHGTMVRQRRTAEIAAEAAGWQLAPSVDEAWNEMDHLAVLAAHPQAFEGEPDARQFQQWFEEATHRWTSGHNDGDYAESFPSFRQRVLDALDRLANSGTAVVFTSGGPIAAVTAELIGAALPTYRRLAAVVVNGSVTRIVAGQRGLSLVSFNEHAHLERDHLTYR